jgi:hypothetical protein
MPAHCDELVIHAPLQCKFCDQFPELQQSRIQDRVNFTGEHDPTKKPCPAEQRRSLKTINKWHGNRPEDVRGPEIIHRGSRDAQ